MRRRSFVALAATAALLAMLLPGSALAAQPEGVGKAAKFSTDGNYIVQMIDAPVVAYEGGIAGLKATKPDQGKKINPNSADVVKYVGYLNGKHDAALASVGGAKKLYDYVYSFNGFAADLTAAQANKLAVAEGIVAVTPDEMKSLDTSSTPAFLGLDGEHGFWDHTGAKGEGVIIGIVDGGAWPESLSFADRVDTKGTPSSAPSAKRAYQQISGWNGRCVPGDEFNASMCNQKLIGARFYNAGWGGNAGIDEQLPWEYNSPRDFGGHGTHTASTAGGNAGVPTTGPAAVFGPISGIAPRARIAAYKVCWQTPTGGSCFTTDSVAAIDQAVADGVDVINFSISGSTTNFRDPVEIAFMYAADAGVFVAASAGNSGPTTSTVAHPGPWLTTVAAGTHNRDGRATLTLGDGAVYTGKSSSLSEATAPLVDAEAAGLPGADPTAVRLCYAAVDNGGTAVLDPAKVAGKIVVCDRGVTARINKSLAVQQAGGVGMVLVNTSPNSVNYDLHFVPTVHLPHTDRAAVKAYAATPGATAAISTATIVYNAPAPFTASFSSRGPLRAGGGDLLKPDVIAPGQDILAAVAPPGNAGRDFDLYSGTSMSSPHVAGLAALFKELHPDWSPMAIKSALMTSATDVLDGPNTNPLVIFRQGAGHVAPVEAADPGLVFDSGWNDWLAFICATQPQGLTATCNALWGLGYSKDASDFNAASVAIGDLAGTQTVKRTVTNVGATESYTFSYTGLVGFTVSASPATFTLAPGASQEIEISITRTTAALNTYGGGQLTWAGDQGHGVRIPAVVRPLALAAPAQVSGNGDPISYDVTFGYTGSFSASARGLVPATVNAGTVSQDPDQTFDGCEAQDGTVAYPVTIPAGTTYTRISLFDADVNPGTDLDLYVCQGTSLVGSSGGGTSAEEVNFSFAPPPAGPIALVAYVHGWGVPGGSSPFKLHDWSLGSADAGNMTVTAPATATLGATGTVNLTFSGLTAGTKYLGSVAYGGAAGMPNPTIVRVDVP